ncbi:ABC transporter ATP-binding protein [Tindallia californiensis]|uniref:Tungstate transport system ATP-binding protein n=1 Tax=Tindallia californiensis TaxID=159292 RepID=A0A1H3PWC6_9FIRM|nr:ABC transporter ATP-binding protein [Tindallia californiensis]SDZ05366.1 tungstate transport system ATP-binding protein [Tindallia californiensis]
MKLTMTSLTKKYQNRTVLNIPELELEEGYLWGIIGPNGSGKSTLMKIIAGLLEASSGSVHYEDKKLKGAVKKSMTLVFQKPYLLRTTVFQNIAYPLQIRGDAEKEIRERVNELLESFEIESLRDQKAWTLSGGEGQKVALARALIFKPRLLMLDEPTANIDPSSIMLLEERILEYYKQEKPTILMVTHNIQQTRRLCNRVAFMNEGKVLDSGDLRHLYGAEAHPLVRDFIQKGLI